MEVCDDEVALLISRCALRDQLALKTLYQKAAPLLNSIAFRLLRSEALSNEVLQDSFVQIWNNAGSYRRDQGKPMTWMSSIVRYRAIDKLKAEAKHNRRPDYEEELREIEQAFSGDEPEKDVSQQQSRALIDECLATLERKVRCCITLAYLQGYSREELADSLGANINTVKSWLHRGSERLKKCLESKMVVTK